MLLEVKEVEFGKSYFSKWKWKQCKKNAKEAFRKKVETSKSKEEQSRHKRRKVHKKLSGIKQATFSQGKCIFQMGWRIQEWKHIWGLKLSKILKEGALMVRVRVSKWMTCSHMSPITYTCSTSHPGIYLKENRAPLLSLVDVLFVLMWSIASTEWCTLDLWEMCPNSFHPLSSSSISVSLQVLER